jgi:hypothetical protein
MNNLISLSAELQTCNVPANTKFSAVHIACISPNLYIANEMYYLPYIYLSLQLIWVLIYKSLSPSFSVDTSYKTVGCYAFRSVEIG